ncbi:MAG: AmmeMemoRadiSam system protein B, partial [Patescibacteria group bacterium]
PDLKTIIIISPDHFKAGQSISTHQLAYSTSAGIVEVDAAKAQLLVADGIWDATDARAFENEHGVGALAPYITREFPKAKIVPIFIRANATHAKLLALVDAMKQIQDKNTFIIISADMSHTLPLEQARVHDVQTEQWLENMDPTILENATDANTDSGPGLFVLSTLLKQPKFIQIAHAISSDYVADTKNTTSYIVGFWK